MKGSLARDLERFSLIRARVLSAVGKEIDMLGACKPYEGLMSISFPDYFDSPWEVELHCYVLGRSRHYRWSGQTLHEAVAKMEAEVTPWVAETEKDHSEWLRSRD